MAMGSIPSGRTHARGTANPTVHTAAKVTATIAANPRYLPATIRLVGTRRAKNRVSRKMSSTFVAANVVMLAARTVKISVSPLSNPTATIVAGFALHSFDSFFCDDGNHDERRHRIGPPQPEDGVEQQPAQQDGR